MGNVGTQNARQLSKREANKIDKLDRIRRAARELFAVRGYDETTMREIAKRAGVALGTLFLYATNKRDLLFLIANEVLDHTTDLAMQTTGPQHTLVENYLMTCLLHFRTYSTQTELFKLVLRELLFYDSGEQALRARKNRERLLKLIANFVESAHKNGEIDLPHPPEFIAWLLFSLLQAEIRRWIALDRRDMAEGIEHLWASMSLVLNGISKQPISANVKKSDQRRFLSAVMTRGTAFEADQLNHSAV